MFNSCSFQAKGHQNIIATHNRSFEFSKARNIRKDADCIIGVSADYNIKDFAFISNKIDLKISIEIEDLKQEITAYGSPELTFSEEGFVVRMTSIINSKTGAIYADTSAKTINREIIRKMQDPSSIMKITIQETGKYEKLDFYEGLKEF